ncbi:serine/threonine protein kinase [bacterium]|nr:serine/threonine protein kinase [bacterium]
MIDEIDKYEIKEHLGSGQFGSVYLANDRALGTLKAIKVLDLDDPDDFMEKLEEAQILHKCRHKHIVKVNEANIYDVEGEPKVIIDMEYLKNGSLESKINHNKITTHQIHSLMIDVLFALEHAHTKGVLHRDVKPANILISEYGAKLSDFGLATIVGGHHSGSAKGYITHLPPEYFRNRKTNVQTDVFATGVTFFRCICGYKNWTDDIKAVKNYRQKILDGKIIKSLGYPRFVPTTIRRIINKACNPNPKKRYKGALQMRHSLEKLRPQINWCRTGDCGWRGDCCKTNSKYEITLTQKRNEVKVDIKKNNRRITDACESFDHELDAKEYIESYISQTAYQ